MANTDVDGAALPVDAPGVRVLTHVHAGRDIMSHKAGEFVEVRKSR